MEADCLSVLRQFQTHSLADQANVDLLDRTDSKYLLPIRVLPELLQELARDHTVLHSAEHSIFTYENTYFDTPDWDLYLRHHNGKLNRHKCRYRRYHETDVAFLEIKLKTNKLRTVKYRLPLHSEGPVDVTQNEKSVDAKLYINYRRITLWNHIADERLTLDYDIHYQRPGQGKTVHLDNILIAELKRKGNIYRSPFVRQAKNWGYLPQSLSKYCIGVCLTDNGTLKHNRFKPLLQRLGRVQTIGEAA